MHAVCVSILDIWVSPKLFSRPMEVFGKGLWCWLCVILHVLDVKFPKFSPQEQIMAKRNIGNAWAPKAKQRRLSHFFQPHFLIRHVFVVPRVCTWRRQMKMEPFPRQRWAPSSMFWAITAKSFFSPNVETIQRERVVWMPVQGDLEESEPPCAEHHQLIII